LEEIAYNLFSKLKDSGGKAKDEDRVDEVQNPNDPHPVDVLV